MQKKKNGGHVTFTSHAMSPFHLLTGEMKYKSMVTIQMATQEVPEVIRFVIIAIQLM